MSKRRLPRERVARRLPQAPGGGSSSSFGWHKYTGFEGDTVSIDRFGASAPGPLLLEKFGFTVDNVVAKAKALG